jgi:hypothetical protein
MRKIKTHILCPITFFRKSHRLWDNVEKYDWDRSTTNDVTIWRIRFACWISKAMCTSAHAHVHARTHRPIYNTRWFKYDRDDLCVNKSQFVPVIFEPPCTYCFSTATMVSRTRLSVTLYIHCLSCLRLRYWLYFSPLGPLQIISTGTVNKKNRCKCWGFNSSGAQICETNVRWPVSGIRRQYHNYRDPNKTVQRLTSVARGVALFTRTRMLDSSVSIVTKQGAGQPMNPRLTFLQDPF